MAVDGSLIFDTKINTEGFQKGRKSITNSLDGMKSAVLKFGATLGAIFGVKQIIEFGKKAVESAAEINAANSQLEQTFGSLKASADEAMQRVADASGHESADQRTDETDPGTDACTQRTPCFKVDDGQHLHSP